MKEFVKHFFSILSALRIERDHKAAVMFQKVKVHPFPADSPESDYSKLLTPYALAFVMKQLKLAEKVRQIVEVGETFTVETSEGKKVVSLSNCHCIFYTSMSLPCHHMFALRIKLNQPLFDADLCNKRWTSAYYRATQRLFSRSSTQPLLVSTVSKEHRRKFSQHEKFHKASLLATELASVTSEASQVHFERRLVLLKDLITHWKNGDEVALTEVDEGILCVLKCKCLHP